MILPFDDDTALLTPVTSRHWLVNVSWPSRSQIDGKAFVYLRRSESFVTTRTILRSPEAFPRIDTRPNVRASRASAESLTSISTTNRRPAGCETDKRIPTTDITLDQLIHECQRPAFLCVSEVFLMKLIKTFFVVVPLTTRSCEIFWITSLLPSPSVDPMHLSHVDLSSSSFSAQVLFFSYDIVLG